MREAMRFDDESKAVRAAEKWFKFVISGLPRSTHRRIERLEFKKVGGVITLWDGDQPLATATLLRDSANQTCLLLWDAREAERLRLTSQELLDGEDDRPWVEPYSAEAAEVDEPEMDNPDEISNEE